MDNQQIERMLRERIIPFPKNFTLDGDGLFKLCNGARIALNIPEEARPVAILLLDKYWNVTDSNITYGDAPAEIPEEGYRLIVANDTLNVSASSVNGTRNAFRTCRMLTEPERGTSCISGTWLLPEIHIDDAPALSFRGLHLCVFPENRFAEIEKKIRMAAYLKLNTVVIEFWGTFPFQSHPELCWSEYSGTRAQWASLIKEMREEEGLVMVPQFNILGHASNSRGCTGQHVVLNQHPEMAPLFEPDGWCWCITNPNSIRLLEDAVCEMHDFFGRPPYFHIGFDEAHSVAVCAECRKHKLSDLLREHIRHFHDLLASRGAQVIMWHDMLLNRSDKRWEYYCAHGRDFQHLENLHKELPKDIVMAVWEYGYSYHLLPGPPTYPTIRFFADNGFPTLVCPWRKVDVIHSSAKLAEEQKLLGILETTWHIFYGHEMPCMFFETAQAAWGISDNPKYAQETFATAWRTIVRDMGLTEYQDFGYSDHQIIPSTYGSLG